MLFRSTIVNPSAPGVRALVERAIYHGGYFRLEARVEAAPELVIHLIVPEPCGFAPGAAIKLDMADGWVIPHSDGN